MTRHNDKRQTERLPARGQLHGEVMVYQPMTILDISPRGAQVETTFPLQLDSLHQIRVSLAGLSVVTKGRIAHSRIGELRDGVPVYRSGVEFVELSERAATAIEGFVQSIRAWSAEDTEVLDGEVIDESVRPPRG